ncbi:16S rRNA (guanine(527)-N(7))-methyltransferase RsmG [Capnocytophaga canis]|uniref:Ribosomal RNA small subunit methyltransferase G n=1 Tax=Capnocytophaga canis TaxID=1848903 RepID=A0A0B7IG37_9FLAO|nr:16S rRNA (guanine(527)-N(7))-methyltransferase RsmG [Capnocytophaga canis]CEN48934.1 Ribosomal RNA small subunit methyltransferase G [Capnocytophaga canis]CEN50780.1 Ribosomal RNA small subunit methyltransferase G [Capnocytophaga canis]
MEHILTYFKDLTLQQKEQFAALKSVYESWNTKINVISRKDMDSFYERHVLHSLAIAKVQVFNPSSDIMDVGTGGGFPGIPLAILFPEVNFTLVDSIGKKIKVVKEVAKEIGLENVTAINSRVELIDKKFDFIVSRAVTQMPEFVKWIKGKVKKDGKHELPNGILYLKGGDLSEELATFTNVQLYNISDFFTEDFFETKKVVYLRIK